MNTQNPYMHLDRMLEKLTMLQTIEEGLYGLYQLFENLNPYHFLTIVDKYSIVYDLLREILREELATLEEFTDSRLITKIKDVDLVDMAFILDNPRSWDLNAQPTYSLSLTSKGEQYLGRHLTELKQLELRYKMP